MFDCVAFTYLTPQSNPNYTYMYTWEYRCVYIAMYCITIMCEALILNDTLKLK